jgi:hypothetical protein
MFALSVSLITQLEPGVSYAPRTFSRKLFGSNVSGTRERQCGIFLGVIEGLGLFDRMHAGMDKSGYIERKKDILVYTGRLPREHAAHVGGDWLEFEEYGKRLNQKLTLIIMHYLGTRPPCTWRKVLEDIVGHYEDVVPRRRVYDVVNVLKAVLPHFYEKMNK